LYAYITWKTFFIPFFWGGEVAAKLMLFPLPSFPPWASVEIWLDHKTSPLDVDRVLNFLQRI